jgi:hypothetical protein
MLTHDSAYIFLVHHEISTEYGTKFKKNKGCEILYTFPSKLFTDCLILKLYGVQWQGNTVMNNE